jgi:hypothetical protein
MEIAQPPAIAKEALDGLRVVDSDCFPETGVIAFEFVE